MKLFLIAALIIFVPSVLLAGGVGFETGYELYQGLKNWQKFHEINGVDTIKAMNGILAYGFFIGFLNGGFHMNVLVQDKLLHTDKILKDSLIFETVKLLNYNMPKNIENDQLIMIYVKWAEDNPKELNKIYPYCVYSAIQEAFPYKK